MANEYNIFTSEMDNLADPMRTDLFSVNFYDSEGYSFKYAVADTSQFFPARATLPKVSNVLAKRWYFGTYRQDVINSDRGGETSIEFLMRCDQSYNLRMLQFLGMTIGEGAGLVFALVFGFFSFPLSIVGGILCNNSMNMGNYSTPCSVGTKLRIAGIIVSAVMLFFGFLSLID